MPIPKKHVAAAKKYLEERDQACAPLVEKFTEMLMAIMDGDFDHADMLQFEIEGDIEEFKQNCS